MNYLLLGKDEFSKREFIQKSKQEIFAGTDPGFNYEEFKAGDSSIGTFVEFCQTTPFLSEKRLAVFWAIDDLEDEDKDVLSNYFKNPQKSTCVILISQESNAKRNSFLSELAPKLKNHIFHIPFDQDLPGWVLAHAKKLGCVIDRSAVVLLIERVGKNLDFIDSSLKELALYAHGKPKISEEDVRNLLGRSKEEDVFDLSEAILKKDAVLSLGNLRSLFKDGTSAYEVLAVLAGQFERFSTALKLLKEGSTTEMVSQHLRIPSFLANKFFYSLKSISVEQATWALERMLEVDELTKTGQGRDELSLEMLVLELCERKTSQGFLKTLNI